jgi:TPR repeat protein
MKYLSYFALPLVLSLSACSPKKDPLSNAAGDPIPKELALILARAEKGDANAQFELFQKYRKMERTKEGDVEAAKWCIRAAEQGHAEALGFVYNLYDTGQGIPRDDTKALEWLLKAAEAKPSSNLYRWVAERYEQGKGTPKRPAVAIVWYKKALDQDDKLSAYRLGMIYWEGEGVSKDYKEAVAYFQEAAALGDHDDARYHLAKAYANGNGVPKDPVQAYAWIRILMLEPEGMALKRLLENVLTEAQKKEAKEMKAKLEDIAVQTHQARMKTRAQN